MTLASFLIAFLTLGITEAVVKPVAKRWVQRRILKAAPAILREVDRRLPELLTLPTGAALESRVRTIAEEVTGESWATDDLGPLFTMFDLRKAADR